MAWAFDPSAWTDGVTIPHVVDYQHIAADIHTWGGNVDAAGFNLANLGNLTITSGKVGIGVAAPASALVVANPTTLDMFVGGTITNGRAALRLLGQNNLFAGILANHYFGNFRVAAGGGGYVFIDNSTGATAGDITFASFGNGAQDATCTPVVNMTIKQAGGVVLPLLPSSSPGAGTKQLWYDPADGNRVKFSA